MMVESGSERNAGRGASDDRLNPNAAALRTATVPSVISTLRMTSDQCLSYEWLGSGGELCDVLDPSMQCNVLVARRQDNREHRSRHRNADRSKGFKGRVNKNPGVFEEPQGYQVGNEAHYEPTPAPCDF